MKLALEIAGGIVLMVAAVGSWFTFAGVPPYKNAEDHTEELHDLEMEVVGNQIQVFDYRQSNLQREIWNLEDRKARMLRTTQGRDEWFRVWERRLKQLIERKDKNKKVIDKYEKRLSK